MEAESTPDIELMDGKMPDWLADVSDRLMGKRKRKRITR